ncbi:MAG: cobalt-precorrin-5B (C(1))-methyltransferase [Hyphomicrobiaceae bacterium]
MPLPMVGRRKNADTTMLRRGWTTGACATAATKAAYELLVTGTAPDPVEITLPKGENPAFALALEECHDDWARTGIVKDAGDDPDVTHGALIVATLRILPRGSGIQFVAGKGVGTITLPGLALEVGEPAINPVPRQLMRAAIAEAAERHGRATDVQIEISVPGGEDLARRTWNPRLGILGGISILGTTGVVHPYSCSAWIHSIHRGIDVARANGLDRIVGATGSTSEAAARAAYALDDIAMIDMGDFVGGMLKYLRRHPIPNLVVAGGFAKMSKLARGFLDLHSGRSQVDFDWLALRAAENGASTSLCGTIRSANTAAQVLSLCQDNGIDIASEIADGARRTIVTTLRDAPIFAETVIVNRIGAIIAKSPQSHVLT